MFSRLVSTARRMWAATDHGVALADPGDARTHVEWLSAWFGPGVVSAHITHTTVGYVEDGALVAYKGYNASSPGDRAEVLRAVTELRQYCGPITTVQLGTRAAVSVAEFRKRA